jgi:hypothetical protein
MQCAPVTPFKLGCDEGGVEEGLRGLDHIFFFDKISAPLSERHIVGHAMKLDQCGLVQK